MLEELQSESVVVGLKVSMNKTKVAINKHAAKCALFSIHNKMLEHVEEYNYLGQVVNADPIHRKEIRLRIGMGWGALCKHSQIMRSKLPLIIQKNIQPVYCR